MAIAGILLVLFFLGLVIFFIWYAARKPSDEIVLVPTSQRGDAETKASLVLPLSYNQPEGITFTYTGWVLVKDFTTGYGTKRRIFSKGDCPGLYLDSTSNSLMVAVKTYGSTETILIPNIPALKWMHLGIVVNQHSVDVYVNGTLRQHHTLGQLPDQNDAAVVMGPGWNGVLGRLSYRPRSLTNAEIRALSQEVPPDDLVPETSGPQYFDMSWYIGRLNSD